MAALQSRANRLLSNLPFSLVKRKFGSSRLISQKHSEEIQVGNGLLSFETGEIAQFANGSVFISMGETNVLSTIVSGKGDAIKDFLPLTVDYMEKKYAQGVIPGTFNRREGPPRERELLVGRVIDRSIRPLFPAGFYTDVQVMASVLSSDGKYDPDVMAANATSAALMISDIPWAGPVGVIRIGRVDGKLITNPTMEELMLGDLNLVYSCIRDKTMMIEMQSRGISERDLDAALRQAQREAEQILEPQIRLAAKVGKQKRVYKLSTISNRTMEKVKSLSEAPIEAVFTDPTYGKFERGEALDKITQNVRKVLDEECDEESLQVLPKAVDSVRKQIVRKRILEKELRVDGRRLDEVRPLYSRCGNLPSVRGSSLFSRGDTQVLSAVTLGAPGDAQRLDSLVGPSTKHFMLHYSFPPYSINEIGKVGGLNRREVGHGNLAEKALIGVLPKTNEYAYSIRVNSEVMASDGSTSMATVCAGSLALMHAGVPIEEHVAGLSIGLVSEIDPSTGMIKDYRILTDILGLEDHLGDIDFKIAGTKKAVTAIQLDMKPAGIPLEIICQCLEPALKGRLQIIDHMEQVITSPRHEFDRNSPQIVTLKFHNDSLWRLIGPQGVRKRKIEEETGTRISIGEGTLSVHAKNQTSLEKALEKVEFFIGREIEVGGIYKGVVSTIKEYGAFVEINGGHNGLLHVSEMAHEKVSRVPDVVSVGQQLTLMCIGTDLWGNVKLSLKAMTPKPKTKKLVSEDPSKPAKQDSSNLPKFQEDQRSVMEESLIEKNEIDDDSISFSPSIVVIRSAEECDELASSTKTKKRSAKVSSKTKTCSEFDQKSITYKPPHNGELLNSPLSKSSKTVSSSKANRLIDGTGRTSQKPAKKDVNNKVKDADKIGVNAKSLRLGDKLDAKVYQIRSHGLVLDLGGEVRGMYKFETDDERNFEVGEELRVMCISFSTKGIPVMTLSEDN